MNCNISGGTCQCWRCGRPFKYHRCNFGSRFKLIPLICLDCIQHDADEGIKWAKSYLKFRTQPENAWRFLPWSSDLATKTISELKAIADKEKRNGKEE